MNCDQIDEVGIDDAGSLFIRPSTSKFPYIYREAMEVGWDPARHCLFSPKPREWSYLNWYKQLTDAAREQGVLLATTPSTKWSNVPLELQQAIEKSQSA